MATREQYPDFDKACGEESQDATSVDPMTPPPPYSELGFDNTCTSSFASLSRIRRWGNRLLQARNPAPAPVGPPDWNGHQGQQNQQRCQDCQNNQNSQNSVQLRVEEGYSKLEQRLQRHDQSTQITERLQNQHTRQDETTTDSQTADIITRYQHIQGDLDEMANEDLDWTLAKKQEETRVSFDIHFAVPARGSNPPKLASFEWQKRILRAGRATIFADCLFPKSNVSIDDLHGYLPACPRCIGSWPPLRDGWPEIVNHLRRSSWDEHRLLTCFACNTQYVFKRMKKNGKRNVQRWQIVFTRFFDTDPASLQETGLGRVLPLENSWTERRKHLARLHTENLRASRPSCVDFEGS